MWVFTMHHAELLLTALLGLIGIIAYLRHARSHAS